MNTSQNERERFWIKEKKHCLFKIIFLFMKTKLSFIIGSFWYSWGEVAQGLNNLYSKNTKQNHILLCWKKLQMMNKLPKQISILELTTKSTVFNFTHSIYIYFLQTILFEILRHHLKIVFMFTYVRCKFARRLNHASGDMY